MRTLLWRQIGRCTVKTQWLRGRDAITVGDDGNFYNEDSEQVYYWVRPRETNSTMSDTGAESLGIGQDRGGYYTESEIKGAWNAKEGMGYFKKQVDWDSYWGFISERQSLIQAGDLPDPTTSEYMVDYPSAEVEKPLQETTSDLPLVTAGKRRSTTPLK